ncbi:MULTISPECIES: cellulase-like family protein [unclassified Cryobacterium]|uniref:cellulase-like family protein n=1 Tax=unclassified Cryobacterium TaxID=2649013 RepID=UPI002AB57FA9|nr:MULTISPECIES: cellulase-like family protein [unclassified Cryobacterium]MDY7544425.1 cellulase-like family protein [Cryobacterium sp. 5B3]MEB0000761.1 cellulase-like family protein [Cryobacterium sp. RTS3]MEB0202629.1 cellulase-like family protein [Cryobacterium sp. 5I3]MEB0267487.1 cellulase-like family protein [Cryobacterium sp. 10I5]MEB0275506.1 cellulase-like family protein [Cryobacterium sp. 5B3]
MTPSRLTTTPAQLPAKLTITLWDFTWYTQTAKGEPFYDLDRAFAEAVDRGYNTVRICAAPLLLFGEHDIDTTALQFVNMGGDTGQRTRWYNAAGGAVLNGRAHLLALFKAAKRHGCFVIISSWEYQQSSAFLSNSSWHDMLSAIPAKNRHEALAHAEAKLVTYLKKESLDDRIAYVEIHNEVDLSRLTEVPSEGLDTFWAQRPYLENALRLLQDAHPDVLSTVCYGIPPYLDLASIPDNAQVAHQHFYIYGVLASLEAWAQVRAEPPIFPTEELKSILRDDAPPFDEWTTTIEPWRLQATGITTSMFYAYDWVDPIAWDAWLYRHFAEHEIAMKQALEARLQAVMIWATHHDVPAVIGEGWIGYTPLEADFEDGPVGQYFAAYAVQRCADLGYWGTLPGSNSAPHHPGWANIEFQRRLNRLFQEAK